MAREIKYAELSQNKSDFVKCTGNWFVENKSETWSYRYFYPQDFGCRLFELTKDNKVLITNTLDNLKLIDIISIEKFKENFGNKIFFNALYYKIYFSNIGISFTLNAETAKLELDK